MKWKRTIVWDQQQEDHLKQYCPNSEYIKVGYVDITGISSTPFTSKGRKVLSIFDVTPSRPVLYSSLGYADSPYYSEELNIKFLQDIKEIFCNDNWLIFWKPKRNVGSEFISETFKRKQLKIADGNLIRVDPGISASFLVESSDAVISMPFSSPSLIAKFKNIPCMFYDASGCVRNQSSHGIPLLRSKKELKEWFESLVTDRVLDMKQRRFDKVS